MIECDEDCKYLDIIEKVINKDLDEHYLELIFTNDAQMQEINLTNRGFDKSTDVLTFPLANIGQKPHNLGSIVINKDLALKVSKKLGHSLKDEISLLFIHALLHIRGYDHETDKGQMRELEAFYINKFALPKSLIIRTLE